jgi:hypothetical protein
MPFLGEGDGSFRAAAGCAAVPQQASRPAIPVCNEPPGRGAVEK